MPISARTRPTVTLVGPIESVRPFSKKENGVPVGDVLGHNIAIATDGGTLYATAWASDNFTIPSPGTVVAAVAAVTEDSRGAQLTLNRFVTAQDVDAIASAAGVK